MYKSLIGEQVIVIVSSKSEVLFEYTGILSSESENEIELKKAEASQLVFQFGKTIFGDLGENLRKYKENIDTVIINKQYIISCNK